MINSYFREEALSSRFSRKFVLLAFLFGATTLIIPLSTQFLVNSLALSSLLANTVLFLLLLLVFLSVSQILRYFQIVLLEFMQREIFVREMRRWIGVDSGDKTHYMLEIPTLMKSYSMAWGHLAELGLSLIFGLTVIVVLHPAFLIIPLLILSSIFMILWFWRPALMTSIHESSQKYRLLDRKYSGEEISESDLAMYLESRDAHFTYIKRSTLIVSATFVISQLFLLGLGIWFIEASQLSVGQLVAGEIILSGIMVSVTKLPKTMEALYDFETSRTKITSALKGIK